MNALDSFSNELFKIAKEKALYAPGIVAHEAGHAQHHKGKFWRAIRKLVPGMANLYGGARMMHWGAGGPPIGSAEFGAVSAAANAPVIADEAMATVTGLKSLDKKMTKKDWKQTALQLAAMQSSYLTHPVVDLGVMGAAKAGAHPLAQLGLKLVTSPMAAKAVGSLAQKVEGPKVTAREAKKIVDAVAPKGTPVFAIKEPIPGGSLYVPPPDTKTEREVVGATFGQVMQKRDVKTLQRKGGVLLAPLNPEEPVLQSPLPTPAILKTKFKRVR